MVFVTWILSLDRRTLMQWNSTREMHRTGASSDNSPLLVPDNSPANARSQAGERLTG